MHKMFEQIIDGALLESSFLKELVEIEIEKTKYICREEEEEEEEGFDNTFLVFFKNTTLS